jgi:hypothetical protein
MMKFTYENGLWPPRRQSRLSNLKQEAPEVIKDMVQARSDFDAGNKACSMQMKSIMRRTAQHSWQPYSTNCHSEQGTVALP